MWVHRQGVHVDVLHAESILLCGLPAGRCTGFSVIRGLFGSGSSWLVCLRFYVSVNINVNNLLAISKLDFDNSGEPGPQAKGVNHLETPLRQLHATHRASSCAERGGNVQLCSKPRGGTRNRTRDLPKKGSAFITSSDHWTNLMCALAMVFGRLRQCLASRQLLLSRCNT